MSLPFADEGRDVRVTGIVDSLPVRLERGERFEFEVESHEARSQYPGACCSAGMGPRSLRPGERWSFTVRLRRPHGAMNPVGVDFEAWMLERDLRASGYVRLTPPPRRLAGDGVDVPRPQSSAARWWLRERLATHVEGQRYGGVLLALVLGDQRAIADSDWTLFNRTGISHLVSISGLHITMIAALVGGSSPPHGAGCRGCCAGFRCNRRRSLPGRSPRRCMRCWPAGACRRNARSSCC